MTVMCFGTFDVLHPGHEDLFRQAKTLGDDVCVVVARDVTVLEVKGQLPAMGETERLAAVSAHPLVDRAMLGNTDDKYRVIEEIRPDAILLGYDQRSFTEGLEEELALRDLDARVYRADPFQPDVYHSSLLLPREESVVSDGTDALPI